MIALPIAGAGRRTGAALADALTALELESLLQALRVRAPMRAKTEDRCQTHLFTVPKTPGG